MIDFFYIENLYKFCPGSDLQYTKKKKKKKQQPDKRGQKTLLQSLEKILNKV